MKTVNVGVAGIGFMGATHIKSYLKIPGAHLGAICDAVRLPVNGDLSGIAGNIGDAKPLRLDMAQVKAYSKFDELLADPAIDLVDLCVPTPQHHPLCLAALQAGKHVICEKPMARTPARCREIVAAAAKAKGFFMPAMVMRFWPEWAWLKNTIDKKTYGNVLAARFRRVSSPPGWSKASYFKGDDSGARCWTCISTTLILCNFVLDGRTAFIRLGRRASVARPTMWSLHTRWPADSGQRRGELADDGGFWI